MDETQSHRNGRQVCRYSSGPLESRRENLPGINVHPRRADPPLDPFRFYIIAIINLESCRERPLQNSRYTWPLESPQTGYNPILTVVRLAPLAGHDEHISRTQNDRAGRIVTRLRA
jgi:hypothetical protein